MGILLSLRLSSAKNQLYLSRSPTNRLTELENLAHIDITYYWTSSPFVRIIIPFILGLLLFNFLNIDATYYLVAFLLLSVFIHAKLSLYKRFNQHLFSVCIFVTTVLLGNQFALFRTSSSPSLNPNNLETYHGRVLASTLLNNYQRILVEADMPSDNPIDTESKFNVILKSKVLYPQLSSADQIIFRCRPKFIASNPNPLSFDLKTYWNRKGYYLDGYINQNELLITKPSSRSFVGRSRSYIRQTIDQNFEYPSAKGVAKALLLGDKSELDPEIKSTFMDAGAMHVLAVSGLHVGLVAFLFSLLLIPIGIIFPTYKRWLKLLVLVPVWLFAAICEFSPSVTRASIMVSFYLFAEATSRPYLGVNILALTALVLLLYQPNYLYDVGFQLSFMAVLSLLLIYRQIRKLYFPKNKIVQYLWDLTCVTISVQFFLIPILFFHFHRFPLLFIPNSVVAVSSLTLILFAGLTMILFSWQSSLLHIFSWIFEHLILGLNYLLALTNKVPNNNMEDIWINPLEMILLFGVAIGLAIWLYTQYHHHIWYIIVPFALFTLSKSTREYKEQHRNYIVSYSIPYSSGLEISNGDTMYSYSSSKPIHPFVSDNLHSRIGIRHKIDLQIDSPYSDTFIRSEAGIIFTPTKRILILSKKNINDILQLPPMQIDYLILHGDLDSTINTIVSHHHIETILTNCSSLSNSLKGISDLQIINSCDKGWINYKL